MTTLPSRDFETRLGPVRLWAPENAYEGEGPAVLVIGGAFLVHPNAFMTIHEHFPQAGVAFAHLPGNHCPPLLAASIGTYAAAFDEAVSQAFPGRPLVLCGLSTGSLVALAMSAPDVKSMVLVEPPLRTGKLWMMPKGFREMAYGPDAEPWIAPFVEGVFGIYPDRVEDRDYTPLLARLRAPARVLLGDIPLMPERRFRTMPGLVDEPERRLLEAHPKVTVEIAPGAGHNVPKHRSDLLVRALRLSPIR